MSAFWIILGILLSVMVLSYLIGDNPFFRAATYLFIGVTAGYVAVLIIYQVVLPKLILPFLTSDPKDWAWLIVPWLLSMLLLMRLFPRVSRLGNLPLAFMVGVAAAVTIGGALLGTISNQLFAVINLFDLQAAPGSGFWSFLQGVYVLFGTISTLLFFQFFQPKDTAPKKSISTKLLAAARSVGMVFIALTFGALFAGVYMASVLTLIERVDFLSAAFLKIF